MTDIEITGETYNLSRVDSGLFSFDRAMKGGLIVPSVYEVYGFTHVGKSTLAYYLASQIRDSGKIAIADFEIVDQEYVLRALGHAGFTGEIEFVDTESGEIAITKLRDRLLNPEYQAAILDSVGALVTENDLKSEKIDLKGQIGQKPRLMANLMRAGIYTLKRNAAAFFIINHLHPIIGFGVGGVKTSGGVAIHNLSTVRLRLKKEKDAGHHIVVHGKVDKLRFGGKGGEFKYVTIPDHGLHPGLTAIYDADWYGVAEISRTVKIGNKSYGYMKDLVQQAIDGETEVFDDFRKVLNDEVGTYVRYGDTEEDSSQEDDSEYGEESMGD